MEMVDSLDEIKSSRSVCGKEFPNFEMLDAKTASALSKIVENAQFKKKVSLEEQKAQKEGQFLRGRQIAFMIYDYFRVTGAHDAVLDYADFFFVTLHDDNIQEFDTRWDDVLLSMSKIPSDDILESLYKLRIRESALFTSAHRTTNALGSRVALSSVCAKRSVVIWCDPFLIHVCSCEGCLVV